MDEKFELACFQIITYVGTARTHFINAIHCAKEGKYDEAAELIKQGDEAFSPVILLLVFTSPPVTTSIMLKPFPSRS